MKPLKYYFYKSKKHRNTNNNIVTKNISDSFNYLITKLNKNEGRLFFIRFGDGEFMTLLKKDTRNFIYNHQLEKELAESFNLNHKDFLIACPINYPYDEFHAKGVYARFNWQEKMIDLIKSQNFNIKDVYENPCIFHCMALFKPKIFKGFLNNHVRNKKKMFIGSTEKIVAEKLYGKIDFYIKIPKRDAYETINNWWPEVEKNASKCELIIPSAGSTSNVIAIRLWKLNTHVNLLDIGSIVDAAENKVTRTWIRLLGHRILSILEPKPKLTFKEKLHIFFKEIKFYFRNQII